ncbi:hypothetical protein [Flavobacterium sp.]|uniref:hypothetical protein n=1 Tax=Flavobacterium sp. TaxID=239 RepID=UPI0026370A0C|nr:hypothetical protein [Flavobacterium sp.]MDD2985858.1 hypothetical protein [Flavobacterium sp.]
MTKIIVILVLMATSLLSAQTDYSENMQKAFALWEAGKNTEASAVFERIASVEKENWLPNYYIALVNTTTAFETKDKDKVSNLLAKAQNVMDKELALNPENAELLVLQAMIHTAWIVFDPMTNGMKLSGKVMELYGKAEEIAPNNPRVVLNKAEFEIGSAQFFGTDIQPLCAQIAKSIELFATFKPETAFSPNWGLERAQEAAKNCK